MMWEAWPDPGLITTLSGLLCSVLIPAEGTQEPFFAVWSGLLLPVPTSTSHGAQQCHSKVREVLAP